MNALRNIRSDESLQVLVFICLPLLLLLIAFIFWSVRMSRRIARFPTFSVRMEDLRERSFLVFREGEKILELDVIPTGSNFFVPSIKVRMPKQLSEKEIAAIVPKLALGLKKLPYEFSIHQADGAEIPKDEYAVKAELKLFS